MKRRLRSLALALALAPIACGDDGTDGGLDDTGVAAADTQVIFDSVAADTVVGADTATTDSGLADSAADTTPTLDPCGRPLRGDDDPRVVVFGRPYQESGQKASKFGTGTLTSDGTLTLDTATFSLGRAAQGTFAFAHHGAVAAVYQEDGSLGIIRIDDGVVTPVTSYEGAAVYATNVAEDPAGTGVYVLDVNWPNNGGGLFHVTLACDGTPSDERLVIQSKNMRALSWIDAEAGLALVDSVDFLGGDAIGDVHRLQIPASGAGTRLESVNAFDADPIVTSLVVTPATGGSRLAIVTENSAFSGVPHRIVALTLPASGSSMTVAQTLRGIKDPYRVVLSPDGDAAMVLSGDGGNALVPLAVDPDADPPLTAGTPLSSPLPGEAVVIQRGGLRGHVVVTQVTGLRQVSFAPDGTLTDHGLVEIDKTLSGLPGALGVQD